MRCNGEDNGLPPWAIKERESNEEGIAHQRGRSAAGLGPSSPPLLFSISVFLRRFREADSAPWNACVLPAESPSRSSVYVNEQASVLVSPTCWL